MSAILHLNTSFLSLQFCQSTWIDFNGVQSCSQGRGWGINWFKLTCISSQICMLKLGYGPLTRCYCRTLCSLTVFIVFSFNLISVRILYFNPLSTSLTKWSNTLKQFVGCQPANCLSVFDHKRSM